MRLLLLFFRTRLGKSRVYIQNSRVSRTAPDLLALSVRRTVGIASSKGVRSKKPTALPETSTNRLRTRKKRRETSRQDCREVAGSIGLQDRGT